MSTPWQAKLEWQKVKNRWRTRRVFSNRHQQHITDNQKDLLSFSTNDYLGLADDPRVIKSVQDAASEYGIGSGASQLITGHHLPHKLFEQEFAEFLGVERCLLFSNGFMANLGVLTTLPEKQDTIFMDKHNHASLIDGGRYSVATLSRFPHLNTDILSNQLCKSTSNHNYIVSDSIFSMSGEIADIPTLIELKRSHSATLMIDDAHGIGVLGENGRGCGEHFSVNPKDIDILICPLGKAFGNFGAIVAGSHSLIEALIQFSRTYIYTTAPPPLLAESARTALKIIKNEYWRREKLIELTEHFQHLAEQHAFIIPNSKTPIQSIIIGENTKTKTISKKLQEKGILAHAILPPTVAEDSARLRVTLTAHHSKQDIDKFFQTLAACCE